MAQEKVDILRTKLDWVKSQSETLLETLSSAINKEADTVANGEDFDFDRFEEINSVLDRAHVFFMARSEDMHKISKLMSRMEALETTMSTHMSQVEVKTELLLLAKHEQENAIQTVGETLNSLVSFKLDNLDAKLQQMIANHDYKTEQQCFKIDVLESQLQEIQLQCPHVHSLKQTTSELTSRLYTLENTIDRLMKSQEKVLPQQFSTKLCFI